MSSQLRGGYQSKMARKIDSKEETRFIYRFGDAIACTAADPQDDDGYIKFDLQPG